MNKKLNKFLYFSVQSLRKEFVKKALNDLDKTNAFSQDELKLIQNERLLSLLQHAVSTVPFYKEYYKNWSKEILEANTDNIEKIFIVLPSISKRDIRENIKNFYSTDTYPTTKNISSGTTGEPLSYPCDQVSWAYRHASLIWFLEQNGIEHGSKHGYMFGQPWKSQLRLKTIMKDLFFNRIRLSAFKQEKEHIEKVYYNFKKKKIEYINGYPSTIFNFCKVCRDELNIDLKSLNLKVVVTTGETLEDFQRKYFKESFGCEVRNYYGSAEGSVASFEGKEGLMHENSCVVKVLLSEENKVIVTDLFLRQFPIIKIETDDVFIPRTVNENTFYHHKVLGELKGRTGQYIHLPDGSKVHPLILDFIFDLFMDDPNVLRWRFVFENIKVTLLVETNLEELSEEFKNKVTSEFNKLFPLNKINIKKVGKIDLLANGKHSIWIQK